MQPETSATLAARETSVTAEPARSRSRYCWEYRFTRHRFGESPGRIESPEQVVEVLRPIFDGAESEVLAVALLDRRHNVIGIEVLYKGHVSGTPVRIGEMFRAAMRVNASAIVLAHQHPARALLLVRSPTS
jgi:DNA repair protein RadC